MPNHPVYEMILHGVTDDLQRQILTVLLDNVGRTIPREEMVYLIYDYRPDPKTLAANADDRRIRICIEAMQLLEYPIVSANGKGYKISTEADELKTYIDKLGETVKSLNTKIESLEKSRRWLPFIKQWQSRPPVSQERMF